MRLALLLGAIAAFAPAYAYADEAPDYARARKLVLAPRDLASLIVLASGSTSIARTATAATSVHSGDDTLAAYREGLEARRPEDHTPLFRLRHENAASSKDAKCAYCHLGLSGAKRDACNDCHAVMRPRSHGVRFRATEHGRLAALDQRRCATCHEVDYCTECHQIAPDSHYPIEIFTTQHQRLARANPRSCLTCHTFEATCSECHVNGTTPPTAAAGSPLRARKGRIR